MCRRLARKLKIHRRRTCGYRFGNRNRSRSNGNRANHSLDRRRRRDSSASSIKRSCRPSCSIAIAEPSEEIWEAISKLRCAAHRPSASRRPWVSSSACSGNSQRMPTPTSLQEVADYLKSSRPTAVNLAWAVERVVAKAVAASTKRSSPKQINACCCEEAAGHRRGRSRHVPGDRPGRGRA